MNMMFSQLPKLLPFKHSSLINLKRIPALWEITKHNGLLDLEAQNQNGSTPLIILKRTMMKKTRKFTGLHDKDGMDYDENLIYVNSSQNYIYWCNILLHPMSVFGTCNSSYTLWTMYCNPNITDIFSDECLTHLAIPIMAVFLLSNTRGLAHRMITRMYYNDKTKKFTALKLDWTTFFHRKLTFEKSDATPRYGSRTLLTFRGNLTIKGFKFFTAHSDYRSPEYYNALMGYDSPDNKDSEFDSDINKLYGNKKQ